MTYLQERGQPIKHVLPEPGAVGFGFVLSFAKDDLHLMKSNE